MHFYLVNIVTFVCLFGSLFGWVFMIPVSAFTLPFSYCRDDVTDV